MGLLALPTWNPGWWLRQNLPSYSLERGPWCTSVSMAPTTLPVCLPSVLLPTRHSSSSRCSSHCSPPLPTLCVCMSVRTCVVFLQHFPMVNSDELQYCTFPEVTRRYHLDDCSSCPSTTTTHHCVIWVTLLWTLAWGLCGHSDWTSRYCSINVRLCCGFHGCC